MFKFDPKQEYNTNDKTSAVIPETFFSKLLKQTVICCFSRLEMKFSLLTGSFLCLEIHITKY